MDNSLIRAGIVGISGYSGCEILNILLDHPGVRVTYVSAHNTRGYVSDIWPHLKNKTTLYCGKTDIKKAAAACDVLFLAVPHTRSMEITPKLLKKNVRVIDLSADYRLKSVSHFMKWYGKAHKDVGNLAKAVYGLPEIYREKIRKARLIANPGCYPTAAILGLAPVISTQAQNINAVIIDAKSGTTGAGKKVTTALLFSEVNENFKAYKVCRHQHTPEINQYLTRLAGKPMTVTFVPHLLPVNRGILETIYVQMRASIRLNHLHSVYKKFYKTEPFVRVLPLGQQAELKNVNKTNYCDISLALDESNKVLVITSAIDNLRKGAAGQAVQNMNIMLRFAETEGLI